MKSVANITLALLAGIGIGIFFLFGGITMISMLGGGRCGSTPPIYCWRIFQWATLALSSQVQHDLTGASCGLHQAHLQRIYE